MVVVTSGDFIVGGVTVVVVVVVVDVVVVVEGGTSVEASDTSCIFTTIGVFRKTTFNAFIFLTALGALTSFDTFGFNFTWLSTTPFELHVTPIIIVMTIRTVILNLFAMRRVTPHSFRREP